jgi:lysyl endopeptidase
MKMAVLRIALGLTLLGAAAGKADPYPVPDVHKIDSVLASPLDLAAITAEDAEADRRGLPPRFAIPEAVSITPAAHGTWERLPDGTMVWRLRVIGREGTTSLNLGFSRFKLPPHGRLLLYSADGKSGLPPFTAGDNEAHGQLWTPVVLTDDLIVELSVPESEMGEVSLELASINQGYRGFGTEPVIKSGSCNMDVECIPAADPWREEVRAVAVISLGGSKFCSGSLINDTAFDRRMYFITANHCGVNAGNAASLVAYWNYQNSFCRAPGSAQSGQPGNGQLTQFHTGSFFRAGSSLSDFTLVELDDPPVAAFNHFWEGWDRSDGDHACTPAVPCAGIHHANTQEKRITYSTQDIEAPSGDSFLWVHWAPDPPGPYTVPGVTEPGSSGSPLFNSARRFIGQLYGGPSFCGATGDDLSDYYGSFSVSWTGEGTNSTRLSNWLDAGNTGAVAIDGMVNCTPPGAPAIGTAAAIAPNQIQVTWGNGSPAATAFNVYRAAGTCASPGSFTRLAGPLVGSPYTDSAVSGGSTYAYRVTGLDATGHCESAPSACVQATATGICTLPPSFAGLASVTNQGTSTCGLALSWPAATPACAGPIVYDVYRSTTPGVIGGPITTGLNATSYTDNSPLTSGTTYYYVVRAVDASNGAGESNSVQRSAVPTGPIGTTNFLETFEGTEGFDNPGWTHAALSGGVDWMLSTDRSQTPTHSWYSYDNYQTSDRVLVSPPFAAQAGSTLSFWHTYAFDNPYVCYDGGTLEFSTDGGGSWSVLPDAAFTAGGFNATVNSGYDNPLSGKRAWCFGSLGPMKQVTANLAFLAGAANVKLRWREGDDSSVDYPGWYIDSVTLANVGMPTACAANQPTAPLDFHTLTPCRLIDTRNPAGPLGGPALQLYSQRLFQLAGACGVPAGAKALSVNVTVTGPSAAGFLRLYPADLGQPLATTINFTPGQTRGNNAIVSLAFDGSGGVKVQNASGGTVHFILDVNGYLQ